MVEPPKPPADFRARTSKPGLGNIEIQHNIFHSLQMAAILEKIAKLAIPAGLLVGGVQSAIYDGKQKEYKT